MKGRLALTVGEVASLLGCSESHVRRAVKRGLLPVVDPALAGRRVLIPTHALEREVDGLATFRAPQPDTGTTAGLPPAVAPTPAPR